MIKTKRLFYFSFLFCLFLGVCILTTALGSKGRAKNPDLNVLLVTIDTLRADRLSCYSTQHLRTPNVDSLAERGTLFTKAFAHNPTTLPSHANILLGLTPLYHGVRENANFIVRAEFLTLAEYLKDLGYSTGAIIGGYPLHSRFGLAQGFDMYDDDYETEEFQKLSVGERKAEDAIGEAMVWLKTQKSPWFLWIHCFDPHDPYEPPEPFRTQYKENLYDGEVAYVDHELGKVLNHMDEKDLFDKTLIIFTGDHGESLGQHEETTHGFLAYNTTVWVPLIISSPGQKPNRIEQFVSHIDVFPTICDVLDFKKPDSLQGISLLPGIKGKNLPKRTIYFESLYPHYSRGWAPLAGFIQEGEKFIESPIPELYDLEKDFDELHNLAEGKKMDTYRKRLAQVVEEHSHLERDKARQRIDRESLERLKSLGYISSPQVTRKENYGPEDDVKVLLPYHNRAVKALNLYREGKAYEGFEIVKGVITERKDVDIAYTNLATMYKEQGKLKEALEVLELGLENIPTNYGVILAYARYLGEAGRDDEVIKFLESSWLPPMEHDPELWNHLGVAYFNKGDFDKALEALEKARSIDDEYAVVFRNLGNVYLSKFLKSRDPGDLDRTIQNYEKAVELEPEYASAYNSLGVAYREAGRLGDAMRCWEKALELRPDVGYPLLNLGMAYMSKGDEVKALDYFRRYKQDHYISLPTQERERLDALIQRCQRKQ